MLASGLKAAITSLARSFGLTLLSGILKTLRCSLVIKLLCFHYSVLIIRSEKVLSISIRVLPQHLAQYDGDVRQEPGKADRFT